MSIPKDIMVLFVMSTAGCATHVEHNFSSIRYTAEAPIILKEPEFDITKFATFTVLHSGPSNRSIRDNDIIESQLLRVARNVMFTLGYEYVVHPKDADFIVSLYYSNEQESEYIPPHHLPSFLGLKGPLQSFTVPGETVVHFHPLVGIDFVNAESGKTMWSGSATAKTTIPDVRLVGQFMILQILNRDLPKRHGLDNEIRQAGLVILPLTVDGNTYFPTVLLVGEKSNAKLAGIHQFDQIVSIDRRSTEGVMLSELSEWFVSFSGNVEITIKRLDKTIHTKLILNNH